MSGFRDRIRARNHRETPKGGDSRTDAVKSRSAFLLRQEYDISIVV